MFRPAALIMRTRPAQGCCRATSKTRPSTAATLLSSWRGCLLRGNLLGSLCRRAGCIPWGTLTVCQVQILQLCLQLYVTGMAMGQLLVERKAALL